MHALKVEDKDNTIYKGNIWAMVEQKVWRCKMDKESKDNDSREESISNKQEQNGIIEANISGKYISSKCREEKYK